MRTERTQDVKPDEKKGFFVQLPCYLIDKYQDTLTSTAFVAFLRFIRKYSKKGNAEYKGSYRALSKMLNISHTSAIRVTDQWQAAGLATKQEDEESDLLTITVSLAPIWQKNIEYSKELDVCPNLGKVEQNVTTQQLTNGSVVTENASSVTNIDTAVTICDNIVTFCSTFEHKNDPRYRYILDILDTFVSSTKSQQEGPLCDCANASSHADVSETKSNPVPPLPEHSAEESTKPANNSYSQPTERTMQETLFGDADGYTKNNAVSEIASDTPSKTKKPRTTQPKIDLTPEQKEHCRRWYAHFEKVRGEPFETKGDKINAAKYIKMLVLKYDETTIMRIYKHLSEKDFKWSKPSFKFKITPYVVYTEAPSVLQQLATPQEKSEPSPKPKEPLLKSEPTPTKFILTKDGRVIADNRKVANA